MIHLFQTRLILFAAFAAQALFAAPLNVLSAPSQSITPHAFWCATSPALSFESVLAGGCRMQPLDQASVNRGFSTNSFWLQFSLSNPGPEPVQRWISIGDARLKQISIYKRSGVRWVRQDVGNAIPLADRGSAGREWGVLEVDLPAGAVEEVWLRVYSDTPVSLAGTLWEPVAFRMPARTKMLWQTAAFGTLGAATIITLLIWLLFRNSVYSNLAMFVLATMVGEMFRAGLLQTLLWPEDWPVPSHLNGVTHGLQCIFGSRVCRNAVPELADDTRMFRIFRFLEYSVVFSVASTVVIPYALALRLATVCGSLFLLVVGILLCRAWMRGNSTAAVLFWSLSPRLVLQVARFLHTNGVIPLSPLEAIIGPWLMVLSTPLTLITVLERTEAMRNLLDQTRLEQARRESAAQISFLARMSHELRSPLDAILGNAQLIGRSAAPAVRLQVAGIMESGRLLLRLIDDTLDYARGVAGSLRVELEPVSLDLFLRQVERRGRILAARQNNRFLLRAHGSSGLDGMRIDSVRLRQVLDNLIANAARHTRDGEILVDCAVVAQLDGSVRLEFAVADSGCGIPRDQQDRIFRPFERLGPESQYGGKGAGLGLPIARQLVELMGGALELDTAVERGARFRFSVRAEALPAGLSLPLEPLEAFDARNYTGHRRNVLVVDDDPGSRAVCSRLLEDLGFVVREAASGKEAAGLLTRLPELDLILTDQFMDNGDGWMLLDAAASARPDIPVILLSAAPPNPPANRTATARFSGHFLKPVDHAALLQLIGELLELEWNSTAADPPAAPEQPVAGIAPPPGLDVLQRLVQVGHITAVESWAHTLRQEHPVHAAFADRVVLAARDIDMASLHTLAFDCPPQADRSLQDTPCP